ncbi:MAG: hypothetical protein HC902_13300 [Calothrix sp. SM1_5_4]|nr:hypothetical protein [Calothrix sp. SM1_5_4]
MMSCFWSLVMAGALSFHAAAQSPRKLNIQSPFDRYDLVLNGERGTIDGKAADLSAVRDLLPVLTNPLGNECPALNGRPEVTVTENGKTRSLYTKMGLITDGKMCLNVGGDGLFYFPVHRDFLIGAKRGSILLKSPLKLFKQGNKILEVKKDGDAWSGPAEEMLNYDFIDRFENSLREYDVRLRVQEDIGKDKAKMIVQSGPDSYTFYKLTNVMWAVKKPGAKWLEASDDWSFWYDLDPGVLEDRYAGQIRFIEDTAKDKESRMAALDKLGEGWSRNLRDLYHKLILNQGEDPAIQEVALKRLKRKPSLETAEVMVNFLEKSQNEDLKREAGIILKLQHPKGPRYNPSAPPDERAKVVEFWRTWWAQNKKVIPSLLVAAILVFAGDRARAVDPSWKFKTLRSPTSSLFTKRIRKLTGPSATSSRPNRRTNFFFPCSRRGRTKPTSSFQDDTDASNGMANFLPFPMIVVYPVLPVPGSSLDEYGDWALEMMIHEYAHILNMYPAHGIYAPFKYIFGGVLRPNAVLPKWYLEGLAVNLESSLSDHGRLRSVGTARLHARRPRPRPEVHATKMTSPESTNKASRAGPTESAPIFRRLVVGPRAESQGRLDHRDLEPELFAPPAVFSERPPARTNGQIGVRAAERGVGRRRDAGQAAARGDRCVQTAHIHSRRQRGRATFRFRSQPVRQQTRLLGQPARGRQLGQTQDPLGHRAAPFPRSRPQALQDGQLTAGALDRRG